MRGFLEVSGVYGSIQPFSLLFGLEFMQHYILLYSVNHLSRDTRVARLKKVCIFASRCKERIVTGKHQVQILDRSRRSVGVILSPNFFTSPAGG
jgi:hypothetical protein